MKNIGPLPKFTGGDVQPWANRLIGYLERWISTLEGDVTAQGKLISRSGRHKHMTLITAASYTILLTDETIDVNRAGAVALTMPENPTLGSSWMVQDGSGDASSYNITVKESASIEINGGSSVVLATDYGNLIITYNGTQYVAGQGP